MYDVTISIVQFNRIKHYKIFLWILSTLLLRGPFLILMTLQFFTGYRKSHTKMKVRNVYILRYMGSRFCVKSQIPPLKLHTKLWTHIPHHINFSECWNFEELRYFKVITSKVFMKRAPEIGQNWHIIFQMRGGVCWEQNATLPAAQMGVKCKHLTYACIFDGKGDTYVSKRHLPNEIMWLC